MTPEELLKHELIGLVVEVVRSKNLSQQGITGEVVDETKNLLVIRAESGEKKVYKGQSSFLFTLPDGKKIRLEGELLLGRSEDRLKKKWQKKRW
jgi:ribonuclease P protein subunit POP4